ncbi:MAG: glycosyltransferase family 9 protein [Pseudobdellovibrio sp.]
MPSYDQKIRHWNHLRIDVMRAWKLALAYAFFAPFNKKIITSKGEILVLRLDDKIGDSITATGFLEALKKAYPQSKLTVLSGLATAEIYRNLSFIDEVHAVKKGALPTLKVYFQLKNKNFKFIINTSHILNPRVLFLTSFLKGENKIGFESTAYKIFTQNLKIDFKKDHIVTRYKNLLKLIGVQSPSELPYIIKTQSLPEVEAVIAGLRAKYKYIIALNSFAGGRLRNLNQVITSTIIKKLMTNKEVVVVSLANAGDHQILNGWSDVIHYPQLSSLNQNIAFAERADLVITPDTSWVHIASALRKKLVAIYREDTGELERNSVIWAPYNTEYKMVIAPAKGENPDDINNVNVDEVVQSARDLLKIGVSA